MSSSSSPSSSSRPSSPASNMPSSPSTLAGSSRFASVKLAKDLPPSSASTASSLLSSPSLVHAPSPLSGAVDERKEGPSVLVGRPPLGRPLTLTGGSPSTGRSPSASPRDPRPSSSPAPPSFSSSSSSAPLSEDVTRVSVLRWPSTSIEAPVQLSGSPSTSSPSSSAPPSPLHRRRDSLRPPPHTGGTSPRPSQSGLGGATAASQGSPSFHPRQSPSPSVSPMLTPQTPPRSLSGRGGSLISVSTIRSPSATSSPVSAAASPVHTPPRFFSASASRRSSFSSSPSSASSSLLSSRAAVFGSQDLLFAVFDFVDFTQLCSLLTVCRRWSSRLGGPVSAAAAAHLPSSYSVDFNATGLAEAAREAKGAGTGGHSRKTSLVGRLLARFACSVPTSPTEDGPSTVQMRQGRALDDSQLPVRRGEAVSPPSVPALVKTSVVASRNSAKHFDYFLRRSSAQLTSLPTSAGPRTALLRRLRHIRHLHFSRRAERRLDGEWVAALIDTLGRSESKLLSLSLCGCLDAADFGVCGRHPPLLSPAFLSAHAINHAKRKPVAVSDSSFALLFCPSTSASCFPALTSLSLANCHHLNDASFLLLSSLPSLLSLDLSSCIQLTDDTVESIVRHHPHITSLSLSSCRSLTNATPYYLSSFLSSSLTSLDLSGVGLINDAGLVHLTTIRRLTSLSLRALEFITDKAVVGLSACEAMTALDISECPLVSSKALASLSLYLQLQSLNLAGCALLNDRGVHYIASSRHERRPRKVGTAEEAVEAGGSAEVESAETVVGVSAGAMERTNGLIPASELLDIVGLDDESDSPWLVHSKASSAVPSPSHTPRSLVQKSPGRVPGIRAALSSLSLSSLSTASPLRHLNLSRCVSLTDQAIRQLTTYSPLLVSLDVSHCLQLTDGCVRLIASMASLTTLSLAGCSRLTNFCLLSLSTMRLHTLVLSSLTSITDEGVDFLCQSRELSSSLRSLSLNDVPRLSDAAVHSLCTACTSLAALSVSACPLLGDQSAFHVAIFSPRMSELCIAGCEALSDEGFSRLLRMPHMEHLDVSHCRRLTAAALLKLTKTPKSPAERAKEEKAQRTRDKRRQKEKEQMLRRGEMHAEDFDDAADEGEDGSGGELSDSLHLLVVRGCNKITEQAVEHVRKTYKRMKVVY